MEHKTVAVEKTSTDAQCPGCGTSFKGIKGLRSHRSQRFVSLACRFDENRGDVR